MPLQPIKVGKPVTDTITLNGFWNKVWWDHQGMSSGQERIEHARMDHRAAIILAGNGFGLTLGGMAVSLFPNHLFCKQNTASENDSFAHSCVLSSGTYDFIVVYYADANGATIQWTLNGEVIGTTDLSSGSGVQVATITDVLIVLSGQQSLQGDVISSSPAVNALIASYALRSAS